MLDMPWFGEFEDLTISEMDAIIEWQAPHNTGNMWG